MKYLLNLTVMLTGVSLSLIGCSGGDSTSYSLLASGQTFKQAKVNSKVDVLWIVDNSGSMQPLQNNLADNFESFMTEFIAKGFDFQIGVNSTDAYKAEPYFNNNPALAKHKDGVGAASNHSGVFTILPSTPNILDVFVMNAKLGVGGAGDERAFSSMKASLNSPLNAGFLRDDSFLAVIILSDEDDFSNPTRAVGNYAGGDHNYSAAGLESVDSYVEYLDTLTGTTGAQRRYSASAIAIIDDACYAAYTGSGKAKGNRYMELANKTGGVLGSVCDTSFADSLTAIQQRILELGTQFYLDNTPIESSIRVLVNSVLVPKDLVNGWTYNADANSVMFHGTAVPSAGSSINVLFDPEKLTF